VMLVCLLCCVVLWCGVVWCGVVCVYTLTRSLHTHTHTHTHTFTHTSTTVKRSLCTCAHPPTHPQAFYKDPQRYAYTFQNYVFLTRMMQAR
jgi:deoxyadenosine/deoxycytidine kinase